MKSNPFPPEFKYWPYLPVEFRLFLVFRIFAFRLPHYLCEKQTLAVAIFICNFMILMMLVPPHPMKMVVCIGSSISSSFLMLIALHEPRRSKIHWIGCE